MNTPARCTACGHKPSLGLGDPPLRIIGYVMPKDNLLRHHREYLCGTCYSCMNLAVHNFITKSKDTFLGVGS